MRTIQTTYRYRRDPTDAQAAQMRRFAGARRWVWNWALRRKKDHYAETHTSLNVGALAAELTALKQEPDGHWYVCFVVEQTAPDREERPVKTHVGVDLGLKTFAITSDGQEVAN